MADGELVGDEELVGEIDEDELEVGEEATDASNAAAFFLGDVVALVVVLLVVAREEK